MECNMVEPLGCDMSAVAENLSNLPQNISDDVVVDGEKSNKVMQLSDVTEVRSEKIELGDKLQMAHDFYVTYAKKVGFTTKIRMTTYDKITKAPINQAIHCNCDGTACLVLKHQHGRIRFQLLGARQGYMSSLIKTCKTGFCSRLN
ncbi:uncharacterized protein [Arachis hypogaea]|uniref:uncharacterized protein n=1 Tax=Arachis hypogaea TaxID=3818 RepID=UPI003B20FAB8